MKANVLRQRIELQEQTITQGALGQTVVWKPTRTLWGRRVPLETKTILQYQQLNTVATDRILLRGEVDITLGTHRLRHGDKVFRPQATATHYEGLTEVVVREEV